MRAEWVLVDWWILNWTGIGKAPGCLQKIILILEFESVSSAWRYLMQVLFWKTSLPFALEEFLVFTSPTYQHTQQSKKSYSILGRFSLELKCIMRIAQKSSCSSSQFRKGNQCSCLYLTTYLCLREDGLSEIVKLYCSLWQWVKPTESIKLYSSVFLYKIYCFACSGTSETCWFTVGVSYK